MANSKSEIEAMLLESFSAVEDSGEGNYRDLINGGEYAEETLTPVTKTESPKKEVEVQEKPKEEIKTVEKPKVVEKPKNVEKNTHKQFGFETSSSQKQENTTRDKKYTNVDNSSLSIPMINRIISLSSLYKGYSPEIRRTIKTFFNVDNEDVAEVVYKVMTEENTILNNFGQLLELRESEPVDRAFLTMSLDSEVLTDIQELVTLFTGSENKYNAYNEKINYCRTLNKNIENLPDKAIVHLKALGDFMKAGQE